MVDYFITDGWLLSVPWTVYGVGYVEIRYRDKVDLHVRIIEMSLLITGSSAST